MNLNSLPSSLRSLQKNSPWHFKNNYVLFKRRLQKTAYNKILHDRHNNLSGFKNSKKSLNVPFLKGPVRQINSSGSPYPYSVKSLIGLLQVNLHHNASFSGLITLNVPYLPIMLCSCIFSSPLPYKKKRNWQSFSRAHLKNIVVLHPHTD